MNRILSHFYPFPGCVEPDLQATSPKPANPEKTMDTMHHLKVDTPIPKTSIDSIDYELFAGFGLQIVECDELGDTVEKGTHIGLWANHWTFTGLDATPVLSVEALARRCTGDEIRLACSRPSGDIPEWAETIASGIEDRDEGIIEADIERRDYLAHLAEKIQNDPAVATKIQSEGVAYHEIKGPFAGEQVPTIIMGHAGPDGVVTEVPMDAASITAATNALGSAPEETESPRP